MSAVLEKMKSSGSLTGVLDDWKLLNCHTYTRPVVGMCCPYVLNTAMVSIRAWCNVNVKTMARASAKVWSCLEIKHRFSQLLANIGYVPVIVGLIIHALRH